MYVLKPYDAFVVSKQINTDVCTHDKVDYTQ